MKRGFTSMLWLLVGLSATAAFAQDDHLDPTAPGRRAKPQSAKAVTADSIRFASRVADGNLVGVTISNYGFIGNNFISRSPSLEYPLGAGFEHLVRGGLWVGAYAQDTARFVGVTTAALDGNQGGASQSATEFTPAGVSVQVRSTLPNNEFYNPSSVSELDMLSDFSDRPAKRSDNNSQSHRPLGIIVHQENYSWSFSDYQHVTIFHYRIKNDGPPLENVWVGIYGEWASGDKNGYSTWPPSSNSGGALGSWFRRKWIQYDGDSLRMFREHYCAGKPVPDNCILERAPYWIGVKLLGWKRSVSDTVLNKRVSLSAWGWSPGSTFRDEDSERYALMSSGVAQPLVGDSLEPASGDPVSLLSVGPFSQVDPGDTIVVDFAIVGGAEIADIQQHSLFAQRAFDRDYIVPVPPPSPRLKVVARHNALDLYWDNSPENFSDPTSGIDFEGYRVYLSEDRLGLHRVAEFDNPAPPGDTVGFNTGFAAVQHDTTLDGRSYHYKYTVDHLRDGFKYFVAVTAFDRGNPEIESLESGIPQNKTEAIPLPSQAEQVGGNKVTVFPNPYRVEARWDAGQKVRDHYLWFANLPQRSKLKIYTLAGDLVYETEFDGSTYHGQNARGVYDQSRELDVDPPTLSGRSFAWDLITREGQAAASGLYMFVVEDKDSGDRQRGKFLLVKSDREDF